jgi:hypothetical protein
MQHNVCKTCGANNGRAGMLINDECLNCYDTRTTGEITIHSSLTRTPEEIENTMGILYDTQNSITK